MEERELEQHEEHEHEQHEEREHEQHEEREHEQHEERKFTEKVVEICKTRPVMVALSLMFVTFWFWLAAMVSPGWFILRWEETKTSDIDEYDYSQSNTDFLSRTETIKYSIEMSIFYLKVCESGKCVKMNYKEFKRLSKDAIDSLPGLTEIQGESISALCLCVLGFLCLLLNFGKSSRVVTGGSFISLAVVLESILVIRMIVANTDAKDDIVDFDLELDVPYSVILACFGIIFSLLALCFCRALYLKLGHETADGRVTNLFPISFPIKFTLLRLDV
ncbi:uncharacterized protein LOC134251052 [Saccostrea cucullata]|uniref:uncharacterized protein LOC134251052 n=1 Tax=Saccostrea cuccullata TaxID=36930 RepID=UPI002ED3B330